VSIRYSTLSGFVRKCIVYAVLLVGFSGTAALAGEPAPDIEVFVRSGCPHCEAAKAFLKELQRERPAVRIAIYDVAEDSAARQRLATLAAERGIASIGVPTFLIGLSCAVQIGLGSIALFVGAINVKDFFALHHGISLSIPESAKPSFYARVRRILQTENFAGALAEAGRRHGDGWIGRGLASSPEVAYLMVRAF
jgi:glutaredoxin